MIVIDASLTVDALTDGGRAGEAAHAALAADPYWVAPEHLRVEVTSAVRGRWLAGKLTDQRANEAVRTLGELTITYADWTEVADRVWQLRHDLTPYDAAYVALAEARGCALVTAEQELLDCPGARCRVEVVGTRG